VSEGLVAEEADVITAGKDERRAIGNAAMVVIAGNVVVFFFILRNGEKMTINRNRTIELIVQSQANNIYLSQ
jgi:hypothetical protein